MTVIYFTDGALVDDVTVRRSLLRIPEVLSALNKSQSEFVGMDLVLCMNEESAYAFLNYHQRQHLKEIIQNALYKRWLKKGNEPDLIVRRKDYGSYEQLKDMFLRLVSIEELNIVTIGPGFDELCTLFRCRKKQTLPMKDVISQDPRLKWFWKDVKNQIQLNS